MTQFALSMFPTDYAIQPIELAQESEKRGFESFALSVFGVPPRDDEAKKLAEIGFTEIIFALPPAPADKVLPMLDSYAAIKRKLGA